MLMFDRLRLLQAGFDGAIKPVEREGLGQVIICSQFHAVAHAGVVRQSGHQDEGNGRGGIVVAQGGKRRVTVHLFHVHVAENQVRHLFASHLHARRAVGRLHDFVAALGQGESDHFPQPLFIVNDQDLLHRAPSATTCVSPAEHRH
jgi:hypothetical protein